MTPEWDILHGDCLEQMRAMAPNTVDAIVTDPPYGLEFMGKDWDHGVPGEAFWREAIRIAKPGAHLLAFGGTRTYHRLACAIEDAGWEIRDCIMWVYGQGFSKSFNLRRCGICACVSTDNPLQYNHDSDLFSVRRNVSETEVMAQESQGANVLSSMQRDSTLRSSDDIQRKHEGSEEKGQKNRPFESVMARGSIYRTSEGLCDDSTTGSPQSKSEWICSGAHTSCGANAESSPSSRRGGSPQESQQGGQQARESRSIREPQGSLDARALQGRGICQRCGKLRKEYQGFGTGLKPSVEPIVVARKPLDGTVAANVQRWGTGAINVDGCRVRSQGQRPIIEGWEQEPSLCDSCAANAARNERPTAPVLKGSTAQRHVEQITSEKGETILGDISRLGTGCSVGLFQEERSVTQNGDGNLNIAESGKNPEDLSQMDSLSITSTETRQTTESTTCVSCGGQITRPFTAGNTIRETTNCQRGQDNSESSAQGGRWPSNLVHDGSDEVLAGFPESGNGVARQSGIGNGQSIFAGSGRTGFTIGDSGSAARFFYCAKASRRERNAGLPDGMTNRHPTVKPVALMRWLVRLVTPPDGLVLDPFTGSGTTGVAARLEGFRFLGIEQDEEYVTTARYRIAAAVEDDATAKDTPRDVPLAFEGERDMPHP